MLSASLLWSTNLFVQAILNPDNTIRAQGETALGAVRDASIDKYYLLLVMSLAQSKKFPDVRQFAAVVLRQVLTQRQRTAHSDSTIRGDGSI